MLTQLYKTLVWPIIQYRNIAWGPSCLGDCTAMEKLQCRATTMMPGLKEKLYKDCLKTLKLPRLLYRCKQGDTSEKVYKSENVPLQTLSQHKQSTHGTTCPNMPSKHQTSIASKTELTSPGRNTTKIQCIC